MMISQVTTETLLLLVSKDGLAVVGVVSLEDGQSL